MIDCGLSPKESDTSEKFFPDKAQCIQAATEGGD